MKLRLLGTGYGECKIKKKTSKDYRKSGGVIVDESILIDAPLDIFDVADELGINDILEKVSDVLITHSHKSHFSPEAIKKLSSRKKINVFATRPLLSMLDGIPNLSLYEISPFTKLEISGYEIIALPTNHNTENACEECLNFLFLGDKNLFYALDGGWINRTAFEYLKQTRLDAIIMDTALELSEPSEKNLCHNDFSTLITIKKILLSCKIAHENTRFILSHIPSSKKRSVHDELSPLARENGFSLAYDGYFARI